MSKTSWARCNAPGAGSMRRGAWYEVVREIDDDYIVLQVYRQLFTVRRDQVTVKPKKPQSWSVVERPGPFGPPPVEGFTQEIITYGVCPNCCDRRLITDDREELMCVGCHKTYPVDRSEPC